MDDLKLTDEEICRTLCGDKYVDMYKPLRCYGCSPKQHYGLPQAQLAKVLKVYSDEELRGKIRHEICCVCVHKPLTIKEGLFKDSPKTYEGCGCYQGFEGNKYCQIATKCATQIHTLLLGRLEEAKKGGIKEVANFLRGKVQSKHPDDATLVITLLEFQLKAMEDGELCDKLDSTKMIKYGQALKESSNCEREG